jgi:putative pyruvate formate lyase activating enzyme
LGLIDRKVHNLNLVTPDHFWPHIDWLCRTLRDMGVGIPVVYNCSGYAKASIVEQVADVVDMFMPDMKFADPNLADLCIGDRRYPDLALAAIRVMVARKGMLRPWDDSGRVTARHGVLVRHLVLPGYAANSIAVLDTLHREFGPRLPLSVMSQYRPTPACLARHDLDRMVSDQEYEQVVRHVEKLGFENVYIQPAHGDQEFMPDFGDRDEPFAGNRRKRPRR